MKSLTVLGLVLVLTICDYCGKDFLVLERHQWRCRGKINKVGKAITVATVMNQSYVKLAIQSQTTTLFYHKTKKQ